MGETYAAIIKAVQRSLSAGQNYGRDGRHKFGACPVCKIHVCITHHKH